MIAHSFITALLLFCNFQTSFSFNHVIKLKKPDIQKFEKKLPYITQTKVQGSIEIDTNTSDLQEWCDINTDKVMEHWCKFTSFFEYVSTKTQKMNEFNITQQLENIEKNVITENVINAGGLLPGIGHYFLVGRMFEVTEQTSALSEGQIMLLQYLKKQQQHKTKFQKVREEAKCLYLLEVEGIVCKLFISKILLERHIGLSKSVVMNTIHYSIGQTIKITKYTKSTHEVDLEFALIDTRKVIKISPSDTLIIKHSEGKTFILTKKPALYLDSSNNQTLTLHNSDFAKAQVLIDYTQEFDKSEILTHDFTICSNGLNQIQIYRRQKTEIEVDSRLVTVHGLMNLNRNKRVITNTGKICQLKTQKFHSHIQFHFENSVSLQKIFLFQNHTFNEPRSIAEIVDHVRSNIGGFTKLISSQIVHFFHMFSFYFCTVVICFFCYVLMKLFGKYGDKDTAFRNFYVVRKIEEIGEKWENNEAEKIKLMDDKIVYYRDRQVQDEHIIKQMGARLDRSEKTILNMQKTIRQLFEKNPNLNDGTFNSVYSNSSSNSSTTSKFAIFNNPPNYTIHEKV